MKYIDELKTITDNSRSLFRSLLKFKNLYGDNLSTAQRKNLLQLMINSNDIYTVLITLYLNLEKQNYKRIKNTEKNYAIK